jgi:hypothetical protein
MSTQHDLDFQLPKILHVFFTPFGCSQTKTKIVT